jgi:hypothetical protein
MRIGSITAAALSSQTHGSDVTRQNGSTCQYRNTIFIATTEGVCYNMHMPKYRKASPLHPQWADIITLDDIRGIITHFQKSATVYEGYINENNMPTLWSSSLKIVRDRVAFWTEMLECRERGEKIMPRVREYQHGNELSAKN